MNIAAIKAGVARIVNACLSKVGHKADYGKEVRAFVMTPTDANGAPVWTSPAVTGTAADSVVRVYAAAVSETEFTACIGVKVRGGQADRRAHSVDKLSQTQLETLLTSTLLDLTSGRFTGPLSSHVPKVIQTRFVERPDQHSTGRKAGSTQTLTDDATAAMLASIAAAEAEADKPADKPKANGSK